MQKKLFSKLSTKLCLVLIMLLYLCVSGLLFWKYGVRVSVDSPRYLDYASGLATDGWYYDPLNFWYMSYVLLVYIFQSPYLIVIVQYLLGFIAVLALFFGTLKLTRNQNVALLACFIFICFPDNLLWHSYILTESLYSSLLCVLFYLIVIILQKGTSKRVFAAISVVGVLCFFSKPTSPVFIVASILTFSIYIYQNTRYRFVVAGISMVVAVGLFLLANQMIGAHAVMLIYEKGDLIFAMHQMAHLPSYELLSVDVPANLQRSEKAGSMLYQMASFVYAHPWFYMKLMFGKAMLFVSHIRPYWSFFHNLYVIVYVWPLYYFVAFTFRRWDLRRNIRAFLIVYFVLHLLIVSITWADWDARFFVPLTPFVSVLGAIGMNRFYKRLLSR